MSILKWVGFFLCVCVSTKEFHNTPEWSMTKVYLFEDKLTVRVVPLLLSSACARNWNSNPAEKELPTLFDCTYSTWDHTQSGLIS